MKINRTIILLINITVLLYCIGLTVYTWTLPKPYVYDYNPTFMENVYYFNEYFLKFIIPLFIALIITIREIRVVFIELTTLHGLLFVFQGLKLFCKPPIFLYEIVTLIGTIVVFLTFIKYGIRRYD